MLGCDGAGSAGEGPGGGGEVWDAFVILGEAHMGQPLRQPRRGYREPLVTWTRNII